MLQTKAEGLQFPEKAETDVQGPKASADLSNRRVVLLLGSPRSGTTWLATILDTYERVIYSCEPFSRLNLPHLNPIIRQLKATGHLEVKQRNTLVRELSRAHHACRCPPFFAKDFIRFSPAQMWTAWFLARVARRGKRFFRRLFSPDVHRHYDALIKEVDWAQFASQLVDGLAAELIIIIRHPCSVVASMLHGHRRGLMFRHDWVVWFKDHQSICRDLGYEEEAVQKMELCQFLALQWLVQNTFYQAVLETYQPSLAVVYEALCRNPRQTVQEIFHFLGWSMSPQTIRFLKRSTAGERLLWTWLQGKQTYFSVMKHSERRLDAWKKELTKAEQEQVLSVVELWPSFAKYWPK